MISVGSLQASLIESLSNDLSEVADLAARCVDPENVEAARAAAAEWSPTRMAHTLAEGMLEG